MRDFQATQKTRPFIARRRLITWITGRANYAFRSSQSPRLGMVSRCRHPRRPMNRPIPFWTSPGVVGAQLRA